MKKLLVAVLMVVFLGLAPGAPGLAQTMVEYGSLASQNGVSRAGAGNHKSGSWKKNRQSRPKKGKGKG